MSALPLPIEVVVPTRNCRAVLPSHLAGISAWADLVEEIVVVDSYSDDGTLDYLRSHLSHAQARFLSHPPGLYQSWNCGIGQLKAKYCYISTVGDPISRAGLQHLFEVAEQFQADVVLSIPAFRKQSGQPLPHKRWTLHDFLDCQGIQAPILAPRLQVFLTSVFFGLAGFMGSSASNLYRTPCLQHRPFPADYGHVGDTAWGISNAFDVQVAVTPETCAQFLIHPNAGQMSDAEEETMELRLLDLARRTLHEGQRAGKVAEDTPWLTALLDRFERAKAGLRSAEGKYYRWRRSPLPWVLNPSAWQARAQRNRHRATIRAMWLAALRHAAV